jgi:hypothetical protein
MPKTRNLLQHTEKNSNEYEYDDDYDNEMESYSNASNNVEDFEDEHAHDYDENYPTYNSHKKTLIQPLCPSLKIQMNDTKFDDKEALDKFKKDYDKNVFNMKFSHCIEIKKIEMSINQIDDLEIKKKELIQKTELINERLIKRQAEKIAKEDEKNKVSIAFEGQFTDLTKTRKELYFLQKEKIVLEKEHNKKIIEFNNIIGIIDNNINTLSEELHVNSCIIDQINREIYNISLKKDAIKQIKSDFQKKITDFENDFEIKYKDFAKLHGWTIIYIKMRNSSPIIEIVKDNQSPTNSISNSILENPISPAQNNWNVFPITSPASVIAKMEQPIPPSMPIPVLRAIVPIIATANYGMKPCNNGNTCINPKCRFLHPPQHTIADGRRNKNELERLERICFEKEKDEYNYYWDMYEYNLELWKKQEMMQSVEAFPVLGTTGSK